MHRLIVVAALAMAGCASMGYQGMSPEAITAASKDKSVNAICTVFTGVWGSGKNFYLNVDQRLVENGGVGVTMNPDNCSFQMNNAATVRPPAAVKPTEVAVPIVVVPKVVTPP
jgi:hypothetical protein